MHFHCISTSAELFQVKDDTIIHKRVRASSLKEGKENRNQQCTILKSANLYLRASISSVLSGLHLY